MGLKAKLKERTANERSVKEQKLVDKISAEDRFDGIQKDEKSYEIKNSRGKVLLKKIPDRHKRTEGEQRRRRNVWGTSRTGMSKAESSEGEDSVGGGKSRTGGSKAAGGVR